MVKDLGDALNGNYKTPSHNAIEASISDILMVDNFHQSRFLGSTVARVMITPKGVSVIAPSRLQHSGQYFFRGACRAAQRAADLDKVDRVISLDESKTTTQEASDLAKVQRRKELQAASKAASYKAKVEAKVKEAEEKGPKTPSTCRKTVSWDDRLDQLRAYRRTQGRWPNYQSILRK